MRANQLRSGERRRAHPLTRFVRTLAPDKFGAVSLVAPKLRNSDRKFFATLRVGKLAPCSLRNNVAMRSIRKMPLESRGQLCLCRLGRSFACVSRADACAMSGIRPLGTGFFCGERGPSFAQPSITLAGGVAHGECGPGKSCETWVDAGQQLVGDEVFLCGQKNKVPRFIIPAHALRCDVVFFEIGVRLVSFSGPLNQQAVVFRVVHKSLSLWRSSSRRFNNTSIAAS